MTRIFSYWKVSICEDANAWVERVIPGTQRNPPPILVKSTEIRFYSPFSDWFGTKRNRKLISKKNSSVVISNIFSSLFRMGKVRSTVREVAGSRHHGDSNMGPPWTAQCDSAVMVRGISEGLQLAPHDAERHESLVWIFRETFPMREATSFPSFK